MRHIPDGVLRRLDDEPLAVPDRVTDHLATCGRCSARRAVIAHDTERVAQLFSAPQLVPDTDVAWARVQRELESPRPGRAVRRSPNARVRARRRWFPKVSLRTSLAIGTIGIVVAGTAAAATVSNIFAPTHVAPVSLSRSDLRAIAAFTGLGDSQVLGGFSAPTGSSRLRFGTITWSSGTAHPTSSLAQAAAEAGFPVSLPARLPAGVGAVQRFVVQPRVTVTVKFNSTVAGLAGSSVTLDARASRRHAVQRDQRRRRADPRRRDDTPSDGPVNGCEPEPDRSLLAGTAWHPAAAGRGGPLAW